MTRPRCRGRGGTCPTCPPRVATLLRVIGLKPSNSAEPWFPATRTRRKTSREIGKAAFAKRHLQFKRLTVTASASTSSFTEEIPECYLSTDPVKTIRKENYRGRVCRYNWHSAGSRVWPFPMLKYKYIFRIKYTEAILSNSTRKLLWFKITKLLITVFLKKTINLLCYLLQFSAHFRSV